MSKMFPSQASMKRCDDVENSVKEVFILVYNHLNVLQGRSFSDYCKEENFPNFIKTVFTECDKKVLSSRPLEQWDLKLLHKLLKFMCGLSPRRDPSWTNVNKLEGLIEYVWHSCPALREASGITEENLNHRLDVLQEYLVKILEKVEEKKNVDLDSVKRRVLNRYKKLTGSYSPLPSCCDVDYMFKHLTHHIIHRIFVMAFKQLSQLGGKTVFDYLKENCNINKPLTIFSNEERTVLEHVSIQPENMSIGLIYKLLQRVCDLQKYKTWHLSSDTLGYYLHCVKQIHDTVVLPKGQKCTDTSRQLYEYLENIVAKVAERTKKSKQDITKEMPDEPENLDSAFQKLPLHQSNTVKAPHSSSCFSPTSSQSAQQPGSLSNKSHQPASSSLPSQKENTSSSVTHDEINVANVFKALCRGGPTAKVLARVYIALSGDISRVSNKIRKDKFTTAEIREAQGDIMKCDITLLYKLLKYACPSTLSPHDDKIWITPGDTIEYYCTCVKNMRNEMAHVVSSFTDDELQSTIDKLESLLENILMKAMAKTNSITHDVLQEMKDEIQPLVNPPPNPVDRASYNKMNRSLREELTSQVLEKAEEELVNEYGKAQNQNSSPVAVTSDNWHRKMTIDKLFTDLDIEEKYYGAVKTKYSLEEMLSLQNNEQRGIRVIILQGVAGAGKTSLCQFLVHVWSVNRKLINFGPAQLLIYIQCRYVSSDSLSSFLRSTLPDTFNNIDKDDVIPLMQEIRVLFLVDGYDEAKSMAKNLIDQILVTLPQSRMIITSRPQWIPKLQNVVSPTGSGCMILTVQGFKEENCDEYIRKMFAALLESSDQHESCNRFLDYLSKLEEQHRTLTQLPLTLGLLILLWIRDSQTATQAKTITQLYRELTNLILERLSSDKFECHKWMLAVGEVAWENLQNNQHHLSDDDVYNLKKKGSYLSGGGTEALSSLLQCDTQTSLTGCSDIWTFTHNCQQEFLAAEFIGHDMKETQKVLSDILVIKGSKGETKKLQRLMQVIEFVVGLLSQDHKMTKERANDISQCVLVDEPWSFDAVHRMANDNLSFRETLPEMFADRTLPQVLDGYNPECVLWILQNTRLGVLQDIQLRNSVSDVLRMEPLLKYLVERSVSSEITITLDYDCNARKAIEFIVKLKDPKVKFVILTWNLLCLHVLVKLWPWPQDLHLSFPSEVFHLLWWELMLCLVAADNQNIDHLGHCKDSPFAKLVQEGAQTLGMPCDTDSPVSHNSIIIYGKTETVDCYSPCSKQLRRS